MIPSFKTEKQVCEFLKKLCKSKKYLKYGENTPKEVQLFRMSSGVTNMGGRTLRFGRKGMADFLLFGMGNNPVWVECKAPGKMPSPDQTSFADQQENEGVYYYCWDGKRVMFLGSGWLQDRELPERWCCGDFTFSLIKEEVKGYKGWYALEVKTRKDLFDILVNTNESN